MTVVIWVVVNVLALFALLWRHRKALRDLKARAPRAPSGAAPCQLCLNGVPRFPSDYASFHHVSYDSGKGGFFWAAGVIPCDDVERAKMDVVNKRLQAEDERVARQTK